MDERKNKMTDERYREILPVAYMTAAIVKGRQPRPVEVGCRFRQEQHRGREWPLVRFQFRLDPWPETIF